MITKTVSDTCGIYKKTLFVIVLIKETEGDRTPRESLMTTWRTAARQMTCIWRATARQGKV